MSGVSAMTFRPNLIISGGQTGADRGGLDAGLELDIPIDGYAPTGLKAEDGVIPAKYTLTELPNSDYKARTRHNVFAANGTIIFVHKRMTPGSWYTQQEVNKLNKHLLVIDTNNVRKVNIQLIRNWLDAVRPWTLNIAGSRESKVPGMQDAVRSLLVEAMSA